MKRGKHGYNDAFNIHVPAGFPVDGTLMQFLSSDIDFSLDGGWSFRNEAFPNAFQSSQHNDFLCTHIVSAVLLLSFTREK